MKKRWTALLLALAMILALTACGGEKQPTEEDAQEGVEDTLEDAQSQPETDGDDAGTDEDMTVVDIEDIEQEQEQEPQLGQQPADTNQKPQTGSGPADTNEKPQSKPVEKPSTEQKPESTASVDLSAFAAGLAESQSDWPGMMAMEGETLEAASTRAISTAEAEIMAICTTHCLGDRAERPG